MQRGLSYGVDAAFPDALQPALLRVYYRASQEWHRFLAQHEDTSVVVPVESAWKSHAQPATDMKGVGKRTLSESDGAETPIGSQKFSSGATQSWLSTRHKTSDVMHLKTKRTKCTDRESPYIILHTQDEFRKIKPRDIETSVFRVGTSERLLENHSMSSFESRAHRSAADCLYYNTEYKVLICKEHGYAIAL
jgi:hypothetical protein